jgi:uncharacterized lipoprotein YmbA
MRSLLLTTVMLMAALAGGCASSPKASFYTLSPVPVSSPAPAGNEGPAAIALGSVTVPEMDDRPQLVLRVDANRVELDEFARWAEPLKGQVRRVVTADLALQFPHALVSGFPLGGDAAASFLVSVDVQNFESAPGDAASLTVLWTVRPPKQGAQVSGRSIVREPTGSAGYDALVAAHSRALAAVSAEIATAIRANLRP